MIQRIHLFYNSVVHGGGDQQAPTRSAPLIDAPSVLFACDLFADVPFTECSMTLYSQRDSVTTQVVAYAVALPAG